MDELVAALAAGFVLADAAGLALAEEAGEVAGFADAAALAGAADELEGATDGAPAPPPQAASRVLNRRTGANLERDMILQESRMG